MSVDLRTRLRASRCAWLRAALIRHFAHPIFEVVATATPPSVRHACYYATQEKDMAMKGSNTARDAAVKARDAADKQSEDAEADVLKQLQEEQDKKGPAVADS